MKKSNKKIKKNKNIIEGLKSLLSDSLYFLIGKKDDVENVLSYFLVLILPLIFLILGTIMVVIRYFKIIFKKGD